MDTSSLLKHAAERVQLIEHMCQRTFVQDFPQALLGICMYQLVSIKGEAISTLTALCLLQNRYIGDEKISNEETGSGFVSLFPSHRERHLGTLVRSLAGIRS